MTTPPPEDGWPQPSAPPMPYGQPAPTSAGYPGYAAPGYPSQPMPGYPPPGYLMAAPPRNGAGTAALVLGIIGLVFCWAHVFGLALNILAICLGATGIKRGARGEATNAGAARAGMILGIIGICLFALLIAMIGSWILTFGTSS